MTNTATIQDHVQEVLTAINADTPELESQIQALESLIFSLVGVHGTTLAQLKLAIGDAFEADLNEPDRLERPTLSEGEALITFLGSN
jgi:hypothetical protein